MPEYKKILHHCQQQKKYTEVLDQFLVYHAAHQDKLAVEFDKRVAKFKHITSQFPDAFKNQCKTQYIIHKVFKEGGLIKKYLNHSAVKKLDKDEQDYLRLMSSKPWRFCFGVINKNPAPDFYEMEDVFTGEEFLLYSRSVKKVIEENNPILWLNLIGFNGECWETYGPIAGYSSFEPDDIFFFASELDHSIEDDDDLLDDLENNPVPYMMLFFGSRYPLTIQSEYEQVLQQGVFPASGFDIEKLKQDFMIEHKETVFNLKHEALSLPPHYAEVFLDENLKIILVSAMTDYGFIELTGLLQKHGFDASTEPDIRVHLPMLALTEDILNKPAILNPYSDLFHPDTPSEDPEVEQKLNHFISSLIPLINSGEKFDLELLANETGIDIETATQIFNNAMTQVNKPR
ncbi:hypothetical protein [Pollutibacter soli]|uniref:hypothetical protein n=1 Tax=Pollutibacter soli TaxID=3034157 RepID=UPI00301403D1